MNFKVTYDKEVDAAYIYLKPIGPGEAVCQIRPAEDIILDMDRDGRLIGIEVLRASTSLPREVIDGAELQAEVDQDSFFTAEPEYLSRQRREAAEKARCGNCHDTKPSDLVAGDFSKFIPPCPCCGGIDWYVEGKRGVTLEYGNPGHATWGRPSNLVPNSNLEYIAKCRGCGAIGTGSDPRSAGKNMSKP